MELEIRCPKCEWEPDGGAYWQCSCGFVWNTFDTAGRCPHCGKVWQDTCCPPVPGGCNKWSPHLDWYRNLDDILLKALKEMQKQKLLV